MHRLACAPNVAPNDADLREVLGDHERADLVELDAAVRLRDVRRRGGRARRSACTSRRARAQSFASRRSRAGITSLVGELRRGLRDHPVLVGQRSGVNTSPALPPTSHCPPFTDRCRRHAESLCEAGLKPSALSSRSFRSRPAPHRRPAPSHPCPRPATPSRRSPPRPSRRRRTSSPSRSARCGATSRAAACVVSLAPVQPSGWPSAMAPPFTFSRSGSIGSSRRHASTCAANASLSSTRSIWSSARPAMRSDLADCRHRADPEALGLDAGRGVRHEARERPQPERARALGRHHDDGGGAVARLGGVAGGDGPGHVEGRAQPRQRFRRGVAPRALVRSRTSPSRRRGPSRSIGRTTLTGTRTISSANRPAVDARRSPAGGCGAPRRPAPRG